MDYQLNDCVFCNFNSISGEVRHHTGRVMSFEPLKPVVPGHRLFVPYKHVSNFSEDPEIFAEVCRVAAQWGERYENANIITSKGEAATQSVFHLHVHVVPRQSDDGLHLPWTGQSKS